MSSTSATNQPNEFAPMWSEYKENLPRKYIYFFLNDKVNLIKEGGNTLFRLFHTAKCEI